MTVCPTSLLAGLIQKEIDAKLVGALLPRSIGDLRMTQIQVAPDSKAVGKRINELELPAESIIITIFKENSAKVPRGSTLIQAGDQVLALCQPYREKEVQELFNGGTVES